MRALPDNMDAPTARQRLVYFFFHGTRIPLCKTEVGMDLDRTTVTTPTLQSETSNASLGICQIKTCGNRKLEVFFSFRIFGVATKNL